jgi:hypothetical protein
MQRLIRSALGSAELLHAKTLTPETVVLGLDFGRVLYVGRDIPDDVLVDAAITPIDGFFVKAAASTWGLPCTKAGAGPGT